jgi:signal transduction histidine kinase
MGRHAFAPLVREAIESHRPAAAVRALRLDDALTSEVFDLECDRGRVLQVFGNLIGNAIKFTPKGGAVTVRAERRGEEMLFSVADTGPGISLDEVSHVFDRYWQTKKTARLGTGLGLSIAKGLVEAHGGRIWVESTLGQGATFFFTIPGHAG